MKVNVDVIPYSDEDCTRQIIGVAKFSVNLVSLTKFQEKNINSGGADVIFRLRRFFNKRSIHQPTTSVTVPIICGFVFGNFRHLI